MDLENLRKNKILIDFYPLISLEDQLKKANKDLLEK